MSAHLSPSPVDNDKRRCRDAMKPLSINKIHEGGKRMGANLVKAVFVNWRHLPDQPFRLLTFMALTCPDARKQPTYYGGRESLALNIGMEDDEAGFRAVKRCVAILIARGAIERAYQGHGGKRSEYTLKVRNTEPQGATGCTPQGATESTPQGYNERPNRGTSDVPPRKNLGREGDENGRKVNSSLEGESRRRAVARAKAPRTSAIDELLAKRTVKAV